MSDHALVIRTVPPNADPAAPHVSTIDAFLPVEACQTWIDRAEAIGFHASPFDANGFRNNLRVIIDDQDAAADLWTRAQHFVPHQLLTRSGPAAALGFNERFRVEPRTGRGLMFPHPIMHTGCEVTRGIKYALRTDVMFASG
jgi:hypothetical protein